MPNKNSTKVPKVVTPTNNKTLGASVINSPKSPPSMQRINNLTSDDIYS